MLNESTALSNNSFNASGDSVPFIIFPASRLAWFRAAALIWAFGRCAEIRPHDCMSEKAKSIMRAVRSSGGRSNNSLQPTRDSRSVIKFPRVES
jgi:hypothetical protein